MGCFNVVGCISDLPVVYGDDIVVFILKKIKRDANFTFYPCDDVEPVFSPFRAKYDDYGSCEDIIDSIATKCISKFFGGVGIQDLMRLLRDDVITDVNDKDMYDKVCQFLKKEDLSEYSIGIEHASYFDNLTKLGMWYDGEFPPSISNNIDYLGAFLYKMYDLKFNPKTNIISLPGSDISAEVILQDGKIEGYMYKIKGDDCFFDRNEKLMGILKNWNALSKLTNDNDLILSADIYETFIYIYEECSKQDDILGDVYDTILSAMFPMYHNEMDTICMRNIKALMKPYCLDKTYTSEMHDLMSIADPYNYGTYYIEMSRCLSAMYKLDIKFKTQHGGKQVVFYDELINDNKFKLEFIKNKRLDSYE